MLLKAGSREGDACKDANIARGNWEFARRIAFVQRVPCATNEPPRTSTRLRVQLDSVMQARRISYFSCPARLRLIPDVIG